MNGVFMLVNPVAADVSPRQLDPCRNLPPRRAEFREALSGNQPSPCLPRRNAAKAGGEAWVRGKRADFLRHSSDYSNKGQQYDEGNDIDHSEAP
jgi:hypothetical protein